MSFLASHQLDIMLFMCGMCGILAFMTVITGSLPRTKKYILAGMEISAMFLLLFDRFSYIYRGDVSTLGFYMVRIGNGMVYALSLIIPFFVTRYLSDQFKNDAKLSREPWQFIASDCLFVAGIILLIINQFTGLYYTFDKNNNYQRAPLHVLCYIVPFLIVVLQEWALIQNIKKVRRSFAVSMIICIAMPTAASVLQIFLYGISITNMVTALIVCVYYTHELQYLSKEAERAKQRKVEFYKESQKKESAMFRETVEALANAIDAKDKYTRGHSTRVAAYARMIAEESGLSKEECDHVYYAGLLHDIGKIGVSNDIINKSAKLTDGEFFLVKAHSETGYQILSSIKQATFLSDGAHYHHERYDGHGYPAGIAGEDIPEIARIIAVADAYDAMTSFRTYSNPLDKDTVREELEKGTGTQFDPKYAKIMLKIMEKLSN